MKKQAYNPFLPEYEYIPDGEPKVFGDRVYLFGSHDRFGGNAFCLEDYAAWSAPTDDLSDWRYEGVSYRKDQDPRSKGKLTLYAPDVVCGPDGRYYMYYSVQDTSVISVAVSDVPAGPYEYYGDVRRPDGHVWGESKEDYFEFDPAVLVDDDGRIWLYSGSGQDYNRRFGRKVVGAFVHELKPDMITTIGEPKIIMPHEKMKIFKPAFFEASSIRKFNGIYYFIYSATNITGLNYCTSQYPDHGFQYRGVIHNTSDIGLNGRNTLNPAYPIGNYHGSVAKIGEKYYVFDHRQTNRSMFSRQAVAEEVQMNPDGSFEQVESTSCGLNGGPLAGKGVYPAYIACNLFPRRIKGIPCSILTPYLTQREMAGKDHPVQYVADIRDGREVGFKYFSFAGDVDRIAVKTAGKASGKLIVSTEENGKAIAEIEVHANRTEPKWKSGVMQRLHGTYGIFIRYSGQGTLDLYSIRFYSKKG